MGLASHTVISSNFAGQLASSTANVLDEWAEPAISGTHVVWSENRNLHDYVPEGHTDLYGLFIGMHDGPGEHGVEFRGDLAAQALCNAR